MRTQDAGENAATNPSAAAPPEEPVALPTPPDGRNTWASGAFLAAAARLVARGEESTYTLRRVVEWATAATGARRAVLWAVEYDEENNPQLALLAWAAADGWRPSELPELRLYTSPALMRAFRSPDVVTVAADRPLERGAEWDARLGLNPIALCAAISAGETRGILAVAGLNADMPDGTSFGEDARTALVACAALAAIVFERHTDGKTPSRPAASPVAAMAEPDVPTVAADDDLAPEAVAPDAAPPAEAETPAQPATPFAEAKHPATPDVAPEPAITPATEAAMIVQDDPVAEHESLLAPLPDRAAMAQRLGEEIGRARRFEHPLAVLLLTIDRREQWTEQLDATGFAALRAHLLGIIRESIREVDLLGTGDDEELIVILPVSSVDDALRVGERIRTTLDNRQPQVEPPSRLRLTISGGAVSYPDDGSSGAELLDAAAHTAAYARRMGRDQIRMRGLGDMESPSQEYLGEAPFAESAPTGGARQIGQAFQALLDALIIAGDAHDQARPGHGQAVGRYAQALAEACGLDPAQVQTIALAGTLHDVGKIGLPADILAKRGDLTPDERAVLRQQPTVGKMMLLQIPALEAIIPLVEHAHERYDGNGYPVGLRGNQIPFGSRLIAIAEGYEAMINERPYRRALSQSMAIAEISREAGSRYDPQLVDTFVRLLGLMSDATGAPLPLEPITLATSAPGLLREETAPALERAEPDEPALEPARASEATQVDGPGVEADRTAAFAPPPIPEASPDAPEMAAPEREVVSQAPEPVTPASEEPTRQAAMPAVEAPARPAGTGAPGTPRRDAPTEAVESARMATPPGTPGPVDAPNRRPFPQATGEEPVGGVTTPAPTTGELVAASEQAVGEASIEWYDDDVAHPDKRVNKTDEEQRPDQLNVEDTILVMSQTTLLRMAELGRLNKRRTGPLARDPKRDDKE